MAVGLRFGRLGRDTTNELIQIINGDEDATTHPERWEHSGHDLLMDVGLAEVSDRASFRQADIPATAVESDNIGRRRRYDVKICHLIPPTFRWSTRTHTDRMME